MDFAGVDSVAGERVNDSGIALFQKRGKQMLGTYVVVAMIATLLLGRA